MCLLVQNPEDGYNRLKRWIMIGDHHQLPPVIKNMAFQKFSNMEQSLFTRFVHLGVPTVDLDAQGRAMPRSVVMCLLTLLYEFFLTLAVNISALEQLWWQRLGRWIYHQKVVSSTPGRVAIKWLLSGWVTVCRQVNNLSI